MITVSIQGAKSTPCIEYAKAVLQGKFANRPVFTGLVEAMVLEQDRRDRGVGLQNMKYSPALDEFAHMTLLSSPRSFRILSEHFSIRSARSFK